MHNVFAIKSLDKRVSPTDREHLSKCFTWSCVLPVTVLLDFIHIKDSFSLHVHFVVQLIDLTDKHISTSKSPLKVRHCMGQSIVT